MARYFGDINTRARGLRTHLLSSGDLERLTRASSLAALQRELSALGYAGAEGPATPASLEQSVRRRAASQMAVLERWCTDARRAALSVIFEDEDRRSIQTLLRGAARGTATETRMTALIPSRSLPERALLTLAKQPTPADVVRLLVFWGHPFGSALVSAASAARPSLFEMEIELHRAFARRASTSAKEGGRQLLEYVQQIVDLMNAWSALLHFDEQDPSIVEHTFVDGGRWITRELFQTLMNLEAREDVEKQLASSLRSSAFAAVFRGKIENLAELEAAALRAQIEWQNRAIRLDPSGAAPVVGFAIELRAQVLDLMGIVWGVALRAPGALIQAEMVVT